jgi:dipeptidyl aminopeptidase/acylaminoacyl peptidase
MRSLLRIAVLALSGAGLAAQDAAVPVPASVKAEGLPPIPASIASQLEPYRQFRRAQLLSWHAARRQMLVATVTGKASQVHAVDAPGTAPKPLTDVPGGVPAGVAGAAWHSPAGGDWFVYRKDTGAAETHQLWRHDSAGQPVLLTDGNSRNGAPAWSAKSGRIAFDSNRRNGKDRDIYVLDPKDPSTSRMLREVSGSWYVAGWSPDDRTIIAVEMLPGNDTALWLVEVETGKPTLLTSDKVPSIWSSAHYAPDGRTIYAVSNRDSELARLWRWRDNTWTPLTPEGDSVESAAVAPDGATIAVVFDRDASSRLELLDARTLQPRLRPALPAGQITDLEWHPSGSEVGFTYGSISMQGDVFSVDAKSGAVTRWTSSPVGGIDAATLPDPVIVRWKSFDGRMISGVLYRPPARFTGPRPVMINIHGGPNNTRERPRFQGRSAYFLNELGIAIIFPNVRGSFGFGRTFEALDDGMKREDAVKDIGALLDWIDAEASLDSRRVMVTGASYGGYMTYAVAAMYPGRIRCAFAAAAISNFVTYLENTEPGRQEDRRAEYGDEREPKMRAFLTAASPVTNAGKIKAPLMIAHGGQDARVPLAQAESMHQAAKANNVPVWLVVYQDAGHENFPRTRTNDDFNFYSWILLVQKYLVN